MKFGKCVEESDALHAAASSKHLTRPDERRLHADFLGDQLHQNPFIVVHFRPHFFSAENNNSVNKEELSPPQKLHSITHSSQRNTHTNTSLVNVWIILRKC